MNCDWGAVQNPNMYLFSVVTMWACVEMVQMTVV